MDLLRFLKNLKMFMQSWDSFSGNPQSCDLNSSHSDGLAQYLTEVSHFPIPLFHTLTFDCDDSRD